MAADSVRSEPKQANEEAEPRTTKPKRRNSWEAKHAIIYDASTQTLSKEKKENLDLSECDDEARDFPKNFRPHFQI